MLKQRARRNMKGNYLDKLKALRISYREKLDGQESKQKPGPGPILVEQVSAGELHNDSSDGDVPEGPAQDQETAQASVEVPHGEVDQQSHKAPRRPKAVAKSQKGKENPGGKTKGRGQKGRSTRKASAPRDNA